MQGIGLVKLSSKPSFENVKHKKPMRLSSRNFNSSAGLRGPRWKAVVMVSDQYFFSWYIYNQHIYSHTIIDIYAIV